MKWLIPLVAAAALISVRASADTTVGVAITRIPIVITLPGVYHLTRNYGYGAATGPAIEIAAGASGTVIDLNGYQIVCTSNAANAATGIYCDGPNRVTVRNGQVLGFENGVFLVSNGATVSNMIVSTAYKAGITVIGDNTEILHNRVLATGGSTLSTSSTTVGITVSGTYGNVTDNDVQNTFTADILGHSAIGILVRNSANVVVNNNRVLEVEPAIPRNGSSTTGIATNSSASLFFLDNIVSTDELGFDLSGAASGDFGDNTTSAPASSYSGTSDITNIGNNN